MVVLEVRPLHEALSDAACVMQGAAKETTAHIAFETPELLLQMLTLERWELLKALCGSGRMTHPEAAQRVGRGVVAVNADIDMLAKAGIIERDDDDVEFPFDRVRVEFMLEAA
jgi:predicted transcriptional regulator